MDYLLFCAFRIVNICVTAVPFLFLIHLCTVAFLPFRCQSVVLHLDVSLVSSIIYIFF